MKKSISLFLAICMTILFVNAYGDAIFRDSLDGKKTIRTTDIRLTNNSKDSIISLYNINKNSKANSQDKGLFFDMYVADPGESKDIKDVEMGLPSDLRIDVLRERQGPKGQGVLWHTASWSPMANIKNEISSFTDEKEIFEGVWVKYEFKYDESKEHAYLKVILEEN